MATKNLQQSSPQRPLSRRASVLPHLGPGTPHGSSLLRRHTVREGGSPLKPTKAAIRKNENLDDDQALKLQELDDLRGQLARSESISELLQKQIKALHADLSSSLAAQVRLEEQVNQKDIKSHQLEAQVKELGRARKDLEKTIESERAEFAKDKEEWMLRDEELCLQMRALKDIINERSLSRRSSVCDNPTNPLRISLSAKELDPPDLPEQQFAPIPTSPQLPISGFAKSLLAKERLIDGLRLELAEAHIRLAEVDQAGDRINRRLEEEIMDLKIDHARLLEENESFQMLLAEKVCPESCSTLNIKTLSGDISHCDFMQSYEPTPPSCCSPEPPSHSTNLAAELEQAHVLTGSDEISRLHKEVQSLQETNKRMALYISTIIQRLLEHKGFEKVLAREGEGYTAPTSVVPTTVEQKNVPRRSLSLLQRTRSLAHRVGVAGSVSSKSKTSNSNDARGPIIGRGPDSPAWDYSLERKVASTTMIHSNASNDGLSLSDVEQDSQKKSSWIGWLKGEKQTDFGGVE